MSDNRKNHVVLRIGIRLESRKQTTEHTEPTARPGAACVLEALKIGASP